MPLEIPEVVIGRLPIYYRLLERIQREGRAVVSSQELGDALGVTPAQIRKDLSYFGRFGKQGRGYSVSRLAEELKLILGLDSRWRVAVVGLGRLGRAISSYPGFDQQGFDIVARFDSDPAIIGTELDGQTIRDVANLEHDLRRDRIDIGIVAVPAEAAQEVVDALVAAGDDSTVRTRSYTGKPARSLRNARTDEWEAKANEIQDFPMQAGVSAREGVMDYMGRGDRFDPNRTFLPAGQGAGLIHEVKPAAEVFADIVREAEETLRELTQISTTA